MLLQTIKSRNLWLWGKIITGSYRAAVSDNSLKEQIAKQEEEINRLENVSAPDYYSYKEKEAALSKANAELIVLKEKLETTKSELVTSFIYKYTNPFKITALQSIDVTWDNPVGESYGLSANFLQSWHNKPVNITFKGISYMGAFGGDTVNNLVTTDDDTNITSTQGTDGLSTTNLAAQALSSGITAASNVINNARNKNISGIKSDTSIEGKYDVVIDTDVEKINSLLSNYGEGLYPQSDKNGAPYIYLLMENPGSGKNNADNFVTYVGHIKNFTYSERQDKPFLYDYTVQFIGEPTLEATLKNSYIKAKQDASSVKLTVVASDSGYSLGYGW